MPGINNEYIELSDIEIVKIGSIIYNIIYAQYPALNLIYSYFINMAKLLNKLNLPIT